MPIRAVRYLPPSPITIASLTNGDVLSAVLDLRRRDVLAARGDDDVLDAVDDPDVGAVDPLPDVAGLQPPVGSVMVSAVCSGLFQ
jgi:hypothetical protein